MAEFPQFDVYVLHSAKPIRTIAEDLGFCGGYGYLGIIYRSFDRDGRRTQKTETNKTIVFCTDQTIKQLEMAFPHYKGRCAEYNWDSFPLPNEENGEVWALHISGVPNDFTVRDAENFITKALSCVLSPGGDNGEPTNFEVEFAPRSRETAEIFGFGRVYFGKHVPRDTIKLCKLILHNTPLPFKNFPEQRRMVTCVWFRPPQPGDRERRRPVGPTENAPRQGGNPTRRPGRAGPQRLRPAAAAQAPVDMTALGTISRDGVTPTGQTN